MNRRTGLTLIELLMVVAIIGILAGTAVISLSPAGNSQLRAVAEVVAEDLAYVRSLAVTYNSAHLLTFETAGNRYVLTRLDGNELPDGVRVTYSNDPKKQVFDFDDMPGLADGVRLMGVRTGGTTPTTVTTLEFGALGQTTQSEATIIWLTIGRGDGLRFISITVDPVSGLTTIGDVQGTTPLGLALPADAVAI